MRFFLILVLLLTLTQAAFGNTEAPPSPTPAQEYREGWLALLSVARTSDGRITPQAKQEALLKAIPHLEAAVNGDSRNTGYSASLAYALMSAGKYQRAQETLAAAIPQADKNPLLYLLRAQAEAALAYMEPTTRSEKIGPALRSFDDAAHNDPLNSLPLIQAASVAFEVGRPDEAFAKLETALNRPGIHLYRFSIPEDLGESQSESLDLWHRAQLWHWQGMLARCQNAAQYVFKDGKAKEEAGDLKGATARYQQALALGKQVGNAQPNCFVAMNTGLNMMEDAYLNLARVAEQTKDPELSRWQGEAGVVSIGRQELFGALRRYDLYLKQVFSSPVDELIKGKPTTVADLLDYEARSVARTMLGVGLAPTHEQLPLGKPKGTTPLQPAAPKGNEQKTNP